MPSLKGIPGSQLEALERGAKRYGAAPRGHSNLFRSYRPDDFGWSRGNLTHVWTQGPLRDASLMRVSEHPRLAFDRFLKSERPEGLRGGPFDGIQPNYVHSTEDYSLRPTSFSLPQQDQLFSEIKQWLEPSLAHLNASSNGFGETVHAKLSTHQIPESLRDLLMKFLLENLHDQGIEGSIFDPVAFIFCQRVRNRVQRVFPLFNNDYVTVYKPRFELHHFAPWFIGIYKYRRRRYVSVGAAK